MKRAAATTETTRTVALIGIALVIATAVTLALGAAFAGTLSPTPATAPSVTAVTTTAVQTCDRILQEDDPGWSESNPCASRLPAWYDACAIERPIDDCLAQVRAERAANPRG